MSAEGKPPAEPSLLARPLAAATGLVTRYPVSVLALSVGAALLAIGLTTTGLGVRSPLGFRTSRLDLLNPDSNFNRLWIEYIDEFGDEDDAVVVVEGPSREHVVPVLDEVSQALAAKEHLFHAVFHGVDLSKIRSKGLYYLPPAELESTGQFLDQMRPIIADRQWSRLKIAEIARGLGYQLARAKGDGDDAATASALDELGRLADSLLAALHEPESQRTLWPEMPQAVATLSEFDCRYLLANRGRLGVVLLRLTDENDEAFARGSEPIDALRKLIAAVQARHPETQIGLTGLPVMENDEMRSSQRSMLEASVLSLLGVACLFVAGFGGLRHPLLTVAALLLAMAWAFGYIALAIGHLNILSIAFAVILIGLGIDFGIHYAARYLQQRALTPSPRDALMETARCVGPGIVTGAVTTAIAFFMAGFTDFTGVAELGMIAGGGILLCCLSALIVLPAMIQLSDSKRLGQSLPAPLDVHASLGPLFARPRGVLIATLSATALVVVGMFGLPALGIGGLRYDHNLLNLQPKGLESVELERKLLNEAELNAWYAVSIAKSREELLQRKQQFEALPSVKRVFEIGSAIAPDHELKRPLIESIRTKLEALPERPDTIPVDHPEALGYALAESQAAAGRYQHALAQEIQRRRMRGDDGPALRRLESNHQQSAQVQNTLERIRVALRQMPEETCRYRIARYQQRMAGDLLSRLLTLRAMANPEPPQLSDLPESLVTRFVGHDGHYLLQIFGKGNIWDMDALGQFVKQIQSVDPRVTGNPVQTYYASWQMKRSYEQAAVYALAAIVVVLLIDFGTPGAPTILRFWLLAGGVAGLAGLNALGLGRFFPALAIVVIGSMAVVDFRGTAYAALAMLPLGLGMLQLFGVMGLLDIPLNPANMIVLPLILGIGIDDGVHLVHDFRCQRGRYRINPSTASAVLITSLTTMVGFGSLMIARHQGLQSLGRVLTIGVSCCLFSSLVILPAVLVLMTRHRSATGSGPSAGRGEAGPGKPHRRFDARHYRGSGGPGGPARPERRRQNAARQ